MTTPAESPPDLSNALEDEAAARPGIDPWYATLLEQLDAGRAARAAAERRSAELRDRQAQRADAVSRLAAGIAHDFNNLLTAIRCSADLLGDSLPAGDSRRHDVDDITRAAERAAALTRQLLGFARQQLERVRLVLDA